MSWSQRRPRTIEDLVSAGLLSGLVFLILCIAAPLRHNAAAASSSLSPLAGPASASRPEGLLFPVPAVSPSAMANSFNDARGERVHHAVDILAPRHSEVVAVADGAIARLTTNAAGGITIYEWGAGQRFVYYYAHLQEYARDLAEGETVRRGQVIGYVGTTGNAPPNTPHLHFAIARVDKPNQWWGGTPIDPYPIWR